jgi:hypothetical protein
MNATAEMQWRSPVTSGLTTIQELNSTSAFLSKLTGKNKFSWFGSEPLEKADGRWPFPPHLHHGLASSAWSGSQLRLAGWGTSPFNILQGWVLNDVAPKLSQRLRHNNGCRDRNHPWAMCIIHDPVNPLGCNVHAYGGVRGPCVYITLQNDHDGFTIDLTQS